LGARPEWRSLAGGKTAGATTVATVWRKIGTRLLHAQDLRARRRHSVAAAKARGDSTEVTLTLERFTT